MAIDWGIGKVVEMISGMEQQGVQRLRVHLRTTEGFSAPNHELADAIHYTDTLPSVEVGDLVLLNITAVKLQLGSGGYHFVYAILDKEWERLDSPSNHTESCGGHMMKLRYTSQQRSFLAAEEQSSPYHPLFTQTQSLEGAPVLIGELHSMLPILLCWLRFKQQSQEQKHSESKLLALPPLRVTYIMSDGGALPLAYSKHVHMLRKLQWLQGTITYGQAYGGELETLNKYTALIAAKHIQQADIIIVTMGPGIAGTGTWLGHSSMEVGEIANAVAWLGGVPVIIPRISFTEARDRHLGLSHHVLSALAVASTPRTYQQTVLPLPANMSAQRRQMIDEQLTPLWLTYNPNGFQLEWIKGIQLASVRESLALYPEAITTMGRGLAADPCFFQGVCAAAEWVWRKFAISIAEV